MVSDDTYNSDELNSYSSDSTPYATTITSELELSATQEQELPSNSAGGLAAGAQALGLDGKLLLAQIFNFVILLIILRKFLYKPLLTLMEQRRQHIEESLAKAQDIDERYRSFQIEHEKRIEQSKNKALDILKEAEVASAQIRAEAAQVAELEALELLDRAKRKIDHEKEVMFRDLRREVGSLVVMLTSKIIGRELDATIQKKLVKEALEEVKS